MSKEKKKKLTLKNFKGTPRKFNETNLKSKGKVLVERKNSTFKSSKPKIEKKPFKTFAPKITPPSDDKQKMLKNGQRKKFKRSYLKERENLKKNLKVKEGTTN